MTGKHIRELFEATPFAPFDILLADGRAIHVPHPDMLNFSRTGRVVLVQESDDSVFYIDLLLVIALRAAAPPEDFS